MLVKPKRDHTFSPTDSELFYSWAPSSHKQSSLMGSSVNTDYLKISILTPQKCISALDKEVFLLHH